MYFTLKSVEFLICGGLKFAEFFIFAAFSFLRKKMVAKFAMF